MTYRIKTNEEGGTPYYICPTLSSIMNESSEPSQGTRGESWAMCCGTHV
eukprot:CAMPEP_0173111022 /NCGR_PEP_ID=MMETSP1102-20130122/44840_1 /TAXON_ID=49646 /ORGANISM="Geminigera sp., Strain Caron Lab Isolate" /LENGTH=48 /DNA_ID= /DNA_START= /DNA_END= /DNA_ORIENTATION=